MADKDKAAEFLDKAKEAENHAAKVKDPDVREVWLGIAERYRNLAHLTGFWSTSP